MVPASTVREWEDRGWGYVGALAGGEFEEAERIAGDQLVLFIREKDFEFPEADTGQGGQVAGFEAIGAMGPERLEGVGSALGEVIGITAQMEAELADIKFPFGTRAGVDADFIEPGRDDDDIIALGMEPDEFGFLAVDGGYAPGDAGMTDEEIKVATQRINLDASGFGAAMVMKEPIIEGGGEVDDGEFIGGIDLERAGRRMADRGSFGGGIFEGGEANEAKTIVLLDERARIAQPELEENFLAGGPGFQAGLKGRPIGGRFQLLEGGRGGQLIDYHEGVGERSREELRRGGRQEEPGDFLKEVGI